MEATAEALRPGFWRRAAAYAIDSVLIAFIWTSIFLVPMVIATAFEAASAEYDALVAVGAVWLVFGPLVTWFAYQWFFNSRGASPGKSRLGIRVID
jgi:uncharacterized RDD family membrane protein YckC